MFKKLWSFNFLNILSDKQVFSFTAYGGRESQSYSTLEPDIIIL
jgi:hypothetical protein